MYTFLTLHYSIIINISCYLWSRWKKKIFSIIVSILRNQNMIHIFALLSCLSSLFTTYTLSPVHQSDNEAPLLVLPLQSLLVPCHSYEGWLNGSFTSFSSSSVKWSWCQVKHNWVICISSKMDEKTFWYHQLLTTKPPPQTYSIQQEDIRSALASLMCRKTEQGERKKSIRCYQPSLSVKWQHMNMGWTNRRKVGKDQI